MEHWLGWGKVKMWNIGWDGGGLRCGTLAGMGEGEDVEHWMGWGKVKMWNIGWDGKGVDVEH